jgi:hypothetical protein
VVDGSVEVTAFHDLSAADWDGIEAEARALASSLLARDGALYARYGHWWSRLPTAPRGRMRVVAAGP